METCGYLYTPQPQNPPPGMMYMKGYTLRGFEGQTYHLHVRYPGDWDELYFRDYLCINAEAAARYAALKLRLRRLYEHDRDAYTAAKGGFIRECTARARTLWPGKHLP